jgi:hypothetical protein
MDGACGRPYRQAVTTPSADEPARPVVSPTAPPSALPGEAGPSDAASLPDEAGLSHPAGASGLRGASGLSATAGSPGTAGLPVAVGERGVRASDGERQAVADRLNTAVGEGRLTLSEFSDRVAAAYAARTVAELDVLVDDLPASRPSLSADVRPADPPSSRRAPLDVLLGAIKRRGRWRIGADTALGVAVGPMKLDLRDADLSAHEVTVSARTVVGAIKVWVPAGIRVYVEGTTAVGTRTIAESNLPPDVDVPTLRLRLDTVLGTVKVYRPKSGDRTF